MGTRKPYAELVKDTFTKTLGERYNESLKSEKIGYWIFISIVISFILLGWLYGKSWIRIKEALKKSFSY